MSKEELKLIDGFFNKGWCCNLDEVYKAVMKLQQENKQLKEQLAQQSQIFADADIEERYGYELENDYLKEQLQQRDEVIEEAKEFVTKRQSFYKSNNQIWSLTICKDVLDILNKYKGDSNG